MAMKFQFNKTELQLINKQLKQRYSALPTLKNKESALRAEVKRYKGYLKQIMVELDDEINKIANVQGVFVEYKNIVLVEKIKLKVQKIAGVKIPVLDGIDFKIADFSLFNSPSWLLSGAELVKKVALLKVKKNVEARKIEILEYARKKTTQKVNLYEKVQIPEFEEAVIKIKRFLADEENLDRASQKIVKKRKADVI